MIHSIRLLIFCLLFASMPVSSADRQPLTFAVVPQQAASKLARLWTPILDRLGAQAGVAIEFQTAKDIPTFEQRLAEGGYDCAYMNPYHFTVFHENPGYEAVARARDKRIKGILVTRKDSPIQNIEDLKGLSLAFPAPAAFAATILPQRELAAKGIDIESNYVSSHDSVYRTVARGLYPAGGGVVRTFKNVAPKISEQLQVLWTTDGYTPHAIACAPDVPSELRLELQAALVHLDSDPAGETLVSAIKIKGFVAAENDDWDDVRALNIDNLSGNSK